MFLTSVLSPSNKYGDRLKVSNCSSRLIIHCLYPCQKRLDISQVQNKWMRVTLPKSIFAFLTVPIIHLVYPPSFLHNNCFNLSWDACKSQEKYKNNAYVKLFDVLLDRENSQYRKCTARYP